MVTNIQQIVGKTPVIKATKLVRYNWLNIGLVLFIAFFYQNITRKKVFNSHVPLN